MTLCKLSLRNARRQAQDYLVYFITVVMAAALIYAFNGLVFSDELNNLSTLMDALPLVVVLTSIVVVGVIGWLVSYATKFMLQRRSRELGTYILIGLEHRQVAQLFFLENLAVGAVALVLGILLGNLVFQALRAITLSLFHVTYQFSFSFSVPAALLSLFYFALMYLYALLKSRRTISRMNIHDLIYFDRKNEGEVIHRERTRRRVFLWSIVSGIVGTGLILLQDLATGILGAALIILFLYGFFISFSSGVPEYFRRRPQRKYVGNTLLVFRTLCAKLSTMGVVMATIALLFTATLIAEGSGLVFNALFQSRAEQTTCFDLFLSSTGRGETALDEYRAYIDAEIPVRDAWSYRVYSADDATVTEYISSQSEYYHLFDRDMLMKASDYTALRAMLGYPAAELQGGQYAVHCMAYLSGVMENYREPLELDSQTLAPGPVYTEPFTQSMWDGNGDSFILVVPDEALQHRPVSHSIYAAMTDQPVSQAAFGDLCRQRDARDGEGQGYDTMFSKAAAERENASMYATIVFPLYYLALVLTMAAATILTIHQLSETARYRRQFQLLRSLGMDAVEMRRALRTQFIIFYAMPALPPVLIGTPFIVALAGALDPGVLDGAGQLAATVALALGLFSVIYFIYILAAYTSLSRGHCTQS